MSAPEEHLSDHERQLVQMCPELEDWIIHQHARCEVMSPILMPMVCPPKPWTGPLDGGYLTRKGQPQDRQASVHDILLQRHTVRYSVYLKLTLLFATVVTSRCHSNSFPCEQAHWITSLHPSAVPLRANRPREQFVVRRGQGPDSGS